MLRDDQRKDIETNLRVAEGAVARQIARGVNTHGQRVNWADYANKLKETLARDDKNESMLRRWLEDPTTWVGIFENQAFDSSQFGNRIAIPIDMSEWDKAKLGQHAPDTRHVIGWKYLLIGKCRTSAAALHILRHKDPKQVLNAHGEDQSLPPSGQ